MHETDPLLGSSSISHHSRSSEGEHMEVQPSDTSQSSDPDHHPSELDRVASGTSSLSLSSEHQSNIIMGVILYFLPARLNQRYNSGGYKILDFGL